MKSEGSPRKVGSTETNSGSDASPCASKEWPRYTIRLESSLSGLSEASAQRDRADVMVLEQCAGFILDRVVKACDFPVGTPAASSAAASTRASAHSSTAPLSEEKNGQTYLFATIAASVARSLEKPIAPIDDLEKPWLAHRRAPEPGKPSTELVLKKQSCTALVLFDAKFAASQVSARPVAEPDIPMFPGFTPDRSFSEWTYDLVLTEDLAEIGTILGTATPRTLRQVRAATTLIHGLPRFASRARAGEFTMAHVQVVTDLCNTVKFKYLPGLDDHLANRRADVTSETLRTSLRKLIQLLEPEEDRYQVAAERRRVEVETYQNGSACLLMTGPALDVHACFRRVEAMARAVHAGQSSTFGIGSDEEIVDDRSIDALMFDILSRPRPTLEVRVQEVDAVTGIQTERIEPFVDAPCAHVARVDGACVHAPCAQEACAHSASNDITCTANSEPNFCDPAAAAHMSCSLPPSAPTKNDGGQLGTGSAFMVGCRPASREVGRRMIIAMPTSEWWLENQAGLIVTVPFLSAFGDSELPGQLPDGSPIPADTARRVVPHSSVLTRILTDPATGTPVDAKATTYRIPKSVRTTVQAQWTVCTVPGCTRKANTSEIDHVVPFFHLDPLHGGMTRFGNLHPLCKKHHAAKTARNLSVHMPESGLVEYTFSHGVRTTVSAPDQPINVAQALEFDSLSKYKPKKYLIPRDKIPPPLMILELMPGPTYLGEQLRKQQQENERAMRARAKQEKFDRLRVARKHALIAKLLNWQTATHQKSLPPGPHSTNLKCLTSTATQHPKRNIWFPTTVNWEHDLESDPPPF